MVQSEIITECFTFNGSFIWVVDMFDYLFVLKRINKTEPIYTSYHDAK